MNLNKDELKIFLQLLSDHMVKSSPLATLFQKVSQEVLKLEESDKKAQEEKDMKEHQENLNIEG